MTINYKQQLMIKETLPQGNVFYDINTEYDIISLGD